jgi:Xaa-Pro aminopeptidase
MTLTVEPGLYFRPGTTVPPHLHGIGVRIEDDVLVQPMAARCTPARRRPWPKSRK